MLAVAIGVAALAIVGLLVARGIVPLDAREAAERVRAAGPLGPIVLFVLLVLQCVIAPIPSEPLMMAAGYVYGARPGFMLAWLGVVTGASACFALARAFGRPLVERFVAAERLSSVDRFVAGRGEVAAFLALLGVRLFAFTSFDVVSYACGLVRFRLPWFLLASAVGVIPKVFAFTYLGATTSARPQWLDWMVAIGTLGMVLLLPLLVRGRWWRRD